MRRTAVALSLLLVLGSCLSSAAREHALFPRVVATWGAVKEDVLLGATKPAPSPPVQQAIAQVDGAVRAEDYQLLRGLDWSALERTALAGVQQRISNGMSEGVAVSFRERIKKFVEAVQVLGR